MPEYGYMDEYNECVSEGGVTVTDNRLTMPATSCVRLLLEGAPVEHLVNPSFDNDYTGELSVTRVQQIRKSALLPSRKTHHRRLLPEGSLICRYVGLTPWGI